MGNVVGPNGARGDATPHETNEQRICVGTSSSFLLVFTRHCPAVKRAFFDSLHGGKRSDGVGNGFNITFIGGARVGDCGGLFSEQLWVGPNGQVQRGVVAVDVVVENRQDCHGEVVKGGSKLFGGGFSSGVGEVGDVGKVLPAGVGDSGR